MSVNLRYKIDGQELANAPKGYDTLTFGLKYSEDLRGIVRSYDSTVELFGADYDLIETLFTNNSLNTKLTFTVEIQISYGSWITAMDAFIVMPRCSLDPHKRIANVGLEDVSFTGSIYQHADLPIPLFDATTLNGESITAVDAIRARWQVSLTENYYIDMVEYGRSLEFIIKYLTDNNVGLSDNWYSALDDYGTYNNQFYGLMYDATTPTPSFKGLFTTLAKLYNLNFSIQYSGGSFTMNIDPIGTFYSSTNAVVVDVESINILVLPEKAYTSVRLGDDATAYDGLVFRKQSESLSILSYPGILGIDTSYSFANTLYQIDSKIGGTSSLDLTTPYGYAIGNYPITQQNGVYNLVQFERDYSSNPPTNNNILEALDHSMTLYYPWIPKDGSTPQIQRYNESEIIEVTEAHASLQNSDVLSRYRFVGDIYYPPVDSDAKELELTFSSSYLVDNDNVQLRFYTALPFEASTQEGSYSIPWNDEEYFATINDVDAGFSSITIDYAIFGTYISDGGDYAGDLTFGILVETTGGLYFIPVVDNSGETDYDIEAATSTSFTDAGSVTLNIPANSTKLSFVYNIYNTNLITPVIFNVEFSDDCTFTITRNHGTRTLIKSAAPTEAKIYGIEFKGYAPIESFMSLYNDPRQNVEIVYEANTYRGWVENVSYNLHTGEFEGRLITDHNNLYNP